MILSHLRTSTRHLLRHPGFTALTLFGLAVGIASFLLVGLWASDELRYDRFNEKADRIYRVLWEAKVGDNEWNIPLVPVPVADALKDFSGVERAVRFARSAGGIRHLGTVVREENFFYTEPDFFRIFSVETLAGDPAAALATAGSVVITDQVARKYFGADDAVGRTLTLADGTVVNVGAVVRGFPEQSHFRFDILAPIESYPPFGYRRTQWGSATVYTYFLVSEGASARDIEARMEEFVRKNVIGDNEQYSGGGNRNGFPFQWMPDIHLRSGLEYELSPGGDIGTVNLMVAIGIFILLLACVNYVNLSTARASQRAHEVGVRKALGSGRASLFVQFLTESALLVAGASALAILLAELTLPWLNGLAGKQLSLGAAESGTVLTAAGVAAAVTLLAGVYPALILSSFSPVRAIKGKVSDGRNRASLRNVLVVFQFTICIGLMIAMASVYGQMAYMLGRDLGFDRQHVLVLDEASALGPKLETFLRELTAGRDVVSAAPAQTLPGFSFDSQLFQPEQPANYERTSLTYAMVDSRYADVLRLKFAEGRNFSPRMATDSSAFLINRAAAAALGWDHPVGRKLNMGPVEGPVIGVVEDFNFESLRSEIKPIVFPFLRWTPRFIAVRLREGDVRDRVAFVEATWKKFLPDRPARITFLDEDYGRLYGKEAKLSDLFTLFTAIALVIACLGLYSLASYSVERRVKEIGVRKVLGASTGGIVGLLSGHFLRLVFISFVVASPLAYFAVDGWLNSFAYRQAPGPAVFMAVGVTALALALLTVSTQAVRAARANPVDSLRDE